MSFRGVECMKVAVGEVVCLESSEFGKGLVEVLADALVLLLFCQQLVFQSVHLLLQFGHSSLGLSGTVLSILEASTEVTDGLLVAIFTLGCLVGCGA